MFGLHFDSVEFLGLLSKMNGINLMVGIDDLKGLFHHKWFYDSKSHLNVFKPRPSEDKRTFPFFFQRENTSPEKTTFKLFQKPETVPLSTHFNSVLCHPPLHAHDRRFFSLSQKGTHSPSLHFPMSTQTVSSGAFPGGGHSLLFPTDGGQQSGKTVLDQRAEHLSMQEKKKWK